jgi:type IV secretory pathway VirD2 relaxase
MASNNGDDEFEGRFGWARPIKHGAGRMFPTPSAASSKRVSQRKRAAWYNRKRGAPNVKAPSPARPSGSQKVMVKIIPVKQDAAGGRSAGSLMRHAIYVERDGAGREGEPAKVFDRDLDEADGPAFVERCEGDRHHFRVIISPEYGGAIDDLKDYTRELMRRVEVDLGMKIDWVAAEHHDTGHPHVHLLMRGVDDQGRDLVMSRDYVSHGFRARAEELATEILGPRLEQDRLSQAVKLERFTDLDRELLHRARGVEISMGMLGDDGMRASRLVQRLNQLEAWALADQSRPGIWRLDEELQDKLIRLGDARDRERATARMLAQENRGLEPERTRELEAAHSSQRVKGRLVGWESLGSDEKGPCLIGVEGIDGKFWTARVSRVEDLRALSGVEHGAIVELSRGTADIKPSDRIIWEIAQDNDLTYSAELHREARPTDRASYIEMHERRLEALRREGIVARDPDGTFRLPENYLDRVLARETMGGRESAEVRLIDPHSIAHQARYHGPTWLDRMADGLEDKSQLRYEGFGAEVRDAWKQRETLLERMGLGERQHDGFYLTEGWHERLAQLELKSIRDRIERDTGRVAHLARDGERVHGIFTNRIHGAQQSWALIAHDRTATLVPWRKEMDRAFNQLVSGQVNGRSFDFKYGRGAEKNVSRGKGFGLDIGF